MESKVFEAECPRCGVTTLMGVGKLYCDPCAEILWKQYQQSRARERKLEWQRMAVNIDLIQTETLLYSQVDGCEINARHFSEVRESKDNVFIFGSVGTGKTYLAKVMLAEAWKSGRTIGEVSGYRIERQAARYADDPLWSQYRRVGLFLIDDLDKMAFTPAACGALWELLDVRKEKRLRTVITSNEDAGTIAKMADSKALRSALDRLKPVLKIELLGKSLR